VRDVCGEVAAAEFVQRLFESVAASVQGGEEPEVLR
jgi:hypothetical protein